jgi:hypothetical protein
MVAIVAIMATTKFSTPIFGACEVVEADVHLALDVVATTGCGYNGYRGDGGHHRQLATMALVAIMAR